MYSTILTELGIAIFDGDKCLKAFPFKNSAEEYILVKKGESKLSELGKFLTNGNGTIVNDRGLLDILKKIICLDVGGSSIKSGIINSKGQLINN